MKAITASVLRVVAGVAVLGLLPAALAHGDDMSMEKGEVDQPRPADQYPPTYFAHPDHRTAIYAHIVLMVLGWVFVLPSGEIDLTPWLLRGAAPADASCL